MSDPKERRGLPKNLQEIVDGLVDAAVVVDKSQNVIGFNHVYEIATGLSGRVLQKRVAQGAKCFELLPLTICKTDCAACRVRESNRPLRLDEIRDASTGVSRTFIVAATPLQDGLVLETYRDVTAEARVQERLKGLLKREREAKKNLEIEVQARTEELRQAHQHMVLQEKLSALGRLVAGIAHELNNPINFIYANVDFVQKYLEDLLALVQVVANHPELPEPFKKRFDACKESIEFDFLEQDCARLIASLRSGAERSADIVRDLKGFSRTNYEEYIEFDVIKHIESTLNIIAPTLKNRIQVKRSYVKNPPTIFCNAGHVDQVFMNILTNAAQAIEDKGEISIEVALWKTNGIRVVISDSGQGIDESDFEKILDPFFTTKDVGKGTGLGLWITQNVVREHGGEMVVSNLKGGGASFEIRLPKRPPEIANAIG